MVLGKNPLVLGLSIDAFFLLQRRMIFGAKEVKWQPGNTNFGMQEKEYLEAAKGDSESLMN